MASAFDEDLAVPGVRAPDAFLVAAVQLMDLRAFTVEGFDDLIGSEGDSAVGGGGLRLGGAGRKQEGSEREPYVVDVSNHKERSLAVCRRYCPKGRV